MRIIAGEHRGRRLVAPKGRETRPMLDRVKEAMFSSIAAEVPDARVLDLFAGSGSLSLEALSRGAASARLVERGRDALKALGRNLGDLGLEDRAQVVRGDALAPRTWREPDAPRADLCFYDPPYALLREEGGRARVLGTLPLLFSGALAPDAVLVFHAPRGALAADELAGMMRGPAREYGTSTLWYLAAVDASDA